MKVMLAVEIAAAYGVARLALRRRGLQDAVVLLRRGGRSESTGRVDDALRLARPVLRTLSLMPADSRCLMRSLVLTRLLARRGIDSRLVIAVRPGEAFAAHAWVEHDRVPLLPTVPDFERLVEL